jgi:hypothetical protein
MKNLILLLSLILVVPVQLAAADWPMWRYDSGRTAESPDELPAKLDLLWQRSLPKPEPAFNDVRLQFDRGYEPVIKDGRTVSPPTIQPPVASSGASSPTDR